MVGVPDERFVERVGDRVSTQVERIELDEVSRAFVSATLSDPIVKGPAGIRTILDCDACANIRVSLTHARVRPHYHYPQSSLGLKTSRAGAGRRRQDATEECGGPT